MTASAPRLSRARFAAVWSITAAAVTIACIVGAILADRYPMRWDVTADRAHSLTTRTRAILGRLDAPVDITIIAPLSAMERASRDRLSDLADALATESADRVTVTLADSADPATPRIIADLVARLAAREAADIRFQREEILRTATDLEALHESVIAVATPMRRIAESVADPSEANRWTGGVAALDPLATDIATAARELPAYAESPTSGTALPEPDGAAAAIAPVIGRIDEGMTTVAREAAALAERSPEGPVRDAATQARDAAQRVATHARTLPERLARLTPTDTLRVARTLERAEAIITAGPTDVVIRPIESLFSGGAVGATFSGEESLVGAIAASALVVRPTVVLVHAEKEPILTPSGAPSPALASVCGRSLTELTNRGWRLAEWSTVTEPISPDRTRLGAAPDDPIAWFVLGSPGTANGDAIRRTETLATGLRRLIDQGANLLITVLPSDLPSLGETDPIAGALSQLGFAADTGRPVVTRSPTAAGPSFSVDQIPEAPGTHPIAGAVRGLPLTLRLATPLLQGQDELPPHTTPLLIVTDDSANTWAEANWRILGTTRASIEPPTPDAVRDRLVSPWVVATATERTTTSSAALPQRIVIVGGALWYADAFTRATIEVNGRLGLRAPGNAQLLDASLAWLAAQDDLIPVAPDVRDVPRIAAIPPGQLSAIRWTLAAGLPAGALLCGVIVHIARRRSRRSTAPAPTR